MSLCVAPRSLAFIEAKSVGGVVRGRSSNGTRSTMPPQYRNLSNIQSEAAPQRRRMCGRWGVAALPMQPKGNHVCCCRTTRQEAATFCQGGARPVWAARCTSVCRTARFETSRGSPWRPHHLTARESAPGRSPPGTPRQIAENYRSKPPALERVPPVWTRTHTLCPRRSSRHRWRVRMRLPGTWAVAPTQRARGQPVPRVEPAIAVAAAARPSSCPPQHDRIALLPAPPALHLRGGWARAPDFSSAVDPGHKFGLLVTASTPTWMKQDAATARG